MGAVGGRVRLVGSSRCGLRTGRFRLVGGVPFRTRNLLHVGQARLRGRHICLTLTLGLPLCACVGFVRAVGLVRTIALYIARLIARRLHGTERLVRRGRRRDRCHRSGRELLGRDLQRSARDRPRMREVIGGHDGGEAAVHEGRLAVVGNYLTALRAFPAIVHHLVLYARTEVQAAVVVAVRRVGRHICFTRAEREPADRRAALLADRHTEFDAADECDQRRSVDRADIALRRHPDPAVVAIGPAAVVIGREAPWLFIDPGPAPRLHVGPLAGAIGLPAGNHGAGRPDIAVFGIVAPAAVAVQVLVAGDGGGDVLRRLVVDDGAVTLGPVGRHRRRRARDGAQLRAAIVVEDFAHFAGAHRQHLAVRSLDLGGAGADPESGRILGRAGLDVVVALLLQGDRPARRQDRVRLVAIVGEGLDVEPALVELHAGLRVVDRQQVELGTAIQAHPSAGDRDLAARIRLGPERVARGQRRIGHRRRPVALVAVVERHRALEERKPTDAGRRIAQRRGNGRGLRVRSAGNTDDPREYYGNTATKDFDH